MDPLADKYPHASPYNYCLNNPVIFVDPDGRAVYIINKSSKMSGTAVKNMNLYFEALYATPDGKKMLEPYVKGDNKNIYFVLTDNMSNDLLGTYWGFEPYGNIPGHDLPSGRRYSMALPYDLSNIVIENPNSENYLVTLNSGAFENLMANFYDIVYGASIIGHEIGAHVAKTYKGNSEVQDHNEWGQEFIPKLDKRSVNNFLKAQFYIGSTNDNPAFRLNQQLLNLPRQRPNNQLTTNTNRNVQKITF
ncbi:MAG: hypothetical protein ACXITV_00015 [Luteibaculaceae bacterium]